MATKQAYPKMERGADGRQKTVYVDMETGDPIPYENLGSYEIITAGGTDYYDPTPDGTDTDADEQDLNPDPKAKKAHAILNGYGPNGGQKSRQESAGYAYATSQAAKSYAGANRGYINKPSWAKYASFLPGTAGLIGKAVNMGINANNVAAVNSARQAMGLPSVGVKGAIKGTLKDNQGQIARVDIEDGTYSVGFEALDKYGRTNMTPEEAMARAKALGVNINEVPDVAPEGAKKGILTRAKEALLGTPEDQAVPSTPSAPRQALYEDDAGNVHVTPDSVIAEREWAGVPEPGVFDSPPEGFNPDVGVAPTGNVYDESGSVMSGIQHGRFDKGLQAAVAAAGPTGLTPTNNPGQGMFSLGEGLVDRAGLAPGSTGLFSASMANLGQPHGIAPAVTAPSMPDPANNFNRGAINAGIMAVDNFATSPANTISAQNAVSRSLSPAQSQPTGIGSDTVASGTATNLGTQPSSARYGDFGGFSSTIRDKVDPVSKMSMAPSGVPDGARFGIAGDLSPTAHTSVFSGVSPNNSVAKNMTASAVNATGQPSRFAGVDLSTASPAQMASLGLTTRTAQEREAMARTIAGELGPKSLKALAANDLAAKTEVANMVASMENRAAKVGTIAGVLSPSQYNSLMSKNMAVTNQNFGIYGTAINEALDGFYSGTVTPSNFGITHYYNPEISDPAWGGVMQNPTEVGQHVFGGIPGDFMPGDAFNAMRDAYSTAQTETTRGFTPSQYSTNNPSYGGGTLGAAGVSSMAAARAGDRASVAGYSGESRGIGYGSGNSAGARMGGGIGSDRAASASSGAQGRSGGSSLSGSGRSSGSGMGGGIGSDHASSAGSGSGKSASGGVSGASRSTSGKTGGSSAPGSSTGGGGVSGAGVGQGGIGSR